MTMPTDPGAQVAGKLEVPVVADLSGFKQKLVEGVNKASKDVKALIGLDLEKNAAKELRKKVKAAAAEAGRGVKTSIGIEVSAKALRKRVKAAADEAGAGVKAEIGVDLDAEGLRKRLQEKVDEAATHVRAKIGVDLDPDALREKLQAAARSASEGVKAHIKVEVDQDHARASMHDAFEHARVRVRVDEDALRGDVERVLGESGGRARDAGGNGDGDNPDKDRGTPTPGGPDAKPDEKDSFLARLRRKIAEGRAEAQKDPIDVPVNIDKRSDFGGGERSPRLRKILRGALIGSLISLAQPAIATITGLIAPLVTLLGPLGQAVGSVGALAPGVAALGVAFITGKVAVSGFGQAFKEMSAVQTTAGKSAKQIAKDQLKLDEALKKLSPSARDVAKEMFGLRGQFSNIKKDVQEAVFKPLIGEFDELKKKVFVGSGPKDNIFGVLHGGLVLMAGSLGTVASKFLDLGKSSPFLNRLGQMFTALPPIFEKIGGAGAIALQAIVTFLVAAAPAAQRLADGFQRGAEHLNDMIEAGHKSGALNTFLQNGIDQAGRLWRIVKDGVGGLVGIFTGGMQSGNSLLVSLEKTMDRFNTWANSAGGQKDIKAYFADMLPVFHQAVGLIGDILKALGRLGDDPSTAKLLKQMRDELVPALEHFLDVLGHTLGPKIIDILSSLVKLFSHLAEAGGGIAFAVDQIDRLFDALNGFLDNHKTTADVLGKIVGYLAGAAILRTGIGLLAKAVGMKGLAGAVASFGGKTVAAGLAGMARLFGFKPPVWGGGGSGKGADGKPDVGEKLRGIKVYWGPTPLPVTIANPGSVGAGAGAGAGAAGAAGAGAAGAGALGGIRGAIRRGVLSSALKDGPLAKAVQKVPGLERLLLGPKVPPGGAPPVPRAGVLGAVGRSVRTVGRVLRPVGRVAKPVAIGVAAFAGISALLNYLSGGKANAATPPTTGLPPKAGVLPPGIGRAAALAAEHPVGQAAAAEVPTRVSGQVNKGRGKGASVKDTATVLGAAAATAIAFAGSKSKAVVSGIERLGALGRVLPGGVGLLGGVGKITKLVGGKGGLAGIAASVAANPLGRLVQGKSKNQSVRGVAGGAVSGGLTGASYGAMLGLLGGPLAPVTSTAGAIGGGIAGAVIGGLNKAMPDLSGKVKATVGGLAGVAAVAIGVAGKKTRPFTFLAEHATQIVPAVGRALGEVGPVVRTAMSGVSKVAGKAASETASAVGKGFGAAKGLATTAIGEVVPAVRTGLTAVGGAVKTGASAAAGFVKTGFASAAGHATSAMSSVGTAARTGLTAVGTTVKTGASAAAGMVKTGLSTAAGHATSAMTAVGTSARTGLTTVGTTMLNGARTASTRLQTGFSTASGYARGAMTSVHSAVSTGLTTVRSTGGALADGISSRLSTGFLKAGPYMGTATKVTFAAMTSGLAAVKSKGGELADGISRRVGDGFALIKELAAAPVRWVGNTVLGGLRNVFNKISGVVKGPEIPPISLGFATGGVVPGYAPGRDTQLAAVSPGEAWLVPEAVRGIAREMGMSREKAIQSINARYSARVRKPAGGRSEPGTHAGYSLGGLVPGGILDKVKDIGSSVLDDAKGLLGGIKDAIAGGLRAAFNAAVSPLKGMLDSGAGSSPIGGMLKGVGHSLFGSLGGFLTKKDAEGGFGNNGALGGAANGDFPRIIEYLRSKGVPFSPPSPGQLTGGKHAIGSFHYAGRAVDFSGPSLEAIFRAFLPVAGGLSELFYTDASEGYNVKNGRKIAPFPDHSDHVHVALAKGGTVLPRPGGTLARIAEAGRAETVVDEGLMNALIEKVLRGGTGGVTFQEGAVVVHNPAPEPASQSVVKNLNRVAAFGMFN